MEKLDETISNVLGSIGYQRRQAKKSIVTYQAGETTQEIFETLSNTGEDYKMAKDKLNAYFAPKKNVYFEIFQFRRATQQPGETIDQFVTRLRKLAAICEFHDASREIKSVVIQNCLLKRLRKNALHEENLKLDDLLAKARSLEAIETQAAGMEKNFPTEEINHVLHKRKQTKTTTKGPPRRPTQASSTTCRQCGLTWPHGTTPCPAKGQLCRKCGKPNHFAKMCHSKLTIPQQRTQQSNHKGKVNQV